VAHAGPTPPIRPQGRVLRHVTMVITGEPGTPRRGEVEKLVQERRRDSKLWSWLGDQAGPGADSRNESDRATSECAQRHRYPSRMCLNILWLMRADAKGRRGCWREMAIHSRPVDGAGVLYRGRIHQRHL